MDRELTNQQLPRRHDFRWKKKDFLPPKFFSEIFGLVANRSFSKKKKGWTRKDLSLTAPSPSLTSIWQHFRAGNDKIDHNRSHFVVIFFITRKPFAWRKVGSWLSEIKRDSTILWYCPKESLYNSLRNGDCTSHKHQFKHIWRQDNDTIVWLSIFNLTQFPIPCFPS